MMYEGVSSRASMEAGGNNPYRNSLAGGMAEPARPEGEVMSLISILSSRLEFQLKLLERLQQNMKPVLCDGPLQEAHNVKPENFAVSCPVSDKLAGCINRVDSANRGLEFLCTQLRV